MRVLVTGGAGFIGSHLVDRLLADGHQVRILDSLEPRVHPSGRRPSHVPVDAEFIHGCVTDADVLERALRSVDVVFHQAAYQDYMLDFSKFLRVNAVGTALLYEVIVGRGLPVRKVIVASSQAVYGEGQYRCERHGFFLPVPRSRQQLADGQWEVRCADCGSLAEPLLLQEEHTNPYNQYAVSKLAQEKTALGLGWLHNIPTVALRYSITQGARQSLYNQYSGICRIFCSRAMRDQPLVVYEDGNQTRDFVHVQDVVEANMLVMRDPRADYRAFNVGSGRRTSVLDYVRAVENVIGKTTRVEITRAFRKGDNRHSVSSISRLQELGWIPKRDLGTILRDFLEWVDSIGGIPADIPDAISHMKEEGVVLSATATR